MTKAQANGMMSALESVKVPASANMAFAADGTESWSVTIPSSFTLTAALLEQLTSYCIGQGLALSAQFQYLGIV